MWFTHLFVPQAVALELKSREFKGAVSEMIAALRKADRVTDDALVRRDVLAREEQGSTWIGRGVAVPHAATPGVNQPLIAHGRSRAGVRFGGRPGMRAHQVFLVLGTPSSGPLHLRILARLASLLGSKEFRAGLDGCENAQQVMALVQAHARSDQTAVVVEEMPRVVAYPAGPEGIGLAAHASLLGCRTRLLGGRREEVEILASMRGINVEGQVKGFARFEWVGTDTAAGLDGADLVLVNPPVHRYREAAREMAGHLRDGQAVVLIPGGLGGALEFQQTLKACRSRRQVYIYESQMSVHRTEMKGPAQVAIRLIRSAVPVAGSPPYVLPEVLSLLNSALPYFSAGGSVFETGLGNSAAFFVPALVVLNAARVEERRKTFQLFRDGVSPSAARILEVLDAERVAVAEALGAEVLPALDWLRRHQGSTGKNLFQAVRTARAYHGVQAPERVDDPVVLDCLLCGLVPLVSLGEKVRVPIPVAASLIKIASAMTGRDLMAEGSTTTTMGLADLSAAQVRRLVETGQAATRDGE